MAYQVDVLVIGGGIIGTSVAYYLAKEGIEVLLIEKDGLGDGTSSACDGFLYLQTKTPGIQLDLAFESTKMYSILSNELDYEVYYEKPGGLCLIETVEQLDFIKTIVEKQKKNGLDVEIIDGREARKLEPTLSERVIAAAHCPLDASVNPLYATLGYAQAAERLGTTIWKQTPATGIIVKDGRVESVMTPKGEIRAKWVVNACGVWAPEIGRLIGLDIPIKPRRGVTLVTESLAPTFKKLLFDARYTAIKHNPKLAENSTDPGLAMGVGLTIEQTENGNALIGNSREFVGFNRQTSFNVTKAIASYASKFVPFLKDVHVIRTFAGLRPFTSDGKAILGPVKGVEGFLMAAGHEGDGVCLAPITGRLISEFIRTGKSSFPLEMFSLSRFA